VSSFNSELLLDDGDDVDHPYGQITGAEFISDSTMVFRGYADWGSETLYSLDLASGDVSNLAFGGIAAQDVRAIELDSSGRLWVGLGGENPSIQVLDSSGELVESLSLNQVPTRIVFGIK